MSTTQTRDFPLHSISLLLEVFKLQLHTSNFNPKVHSLVQEISNPVANLFPLLLSLLCLLSQLVSSLKKTPYLVFNLMDLFEQGGLQGSQDWSTQGDGVRGLARFKERYQHQNRILPELCQEPLLPEHVPPPLAGTLILITPIELHCDLKHISNFYGSNGI